MDLNHLDLIARAIAAGRSRRRLLGALTGSLVGLATLPSSFGPEVEAAKPKSRKKRKPKKQACPKKRRCGKKCCRGATVCRRGVCQKKNPAKPTQTTNPPPDSNPPPDPDPDPDPDPEPDPDPNPGPGGVHIRRSVHDLDPNGPEMQALARGIAVMMDRPESDPTSWLGQANVHLSAQHQSVHFLSWHRMYLYWFERILRKAAGDDTLTIPFWDYTVPSQRILPAPFLNPDSSLYTVHRRELVNEGGEPIASYFNMQGTMGATSFMHGGSGSSFGGSIDAAGQLEMFPHNGVHTFVGGSSGYMRSTRDSPKDPLFWLHHANIDRLWEEWLVLDGHANTSDSVFLNTSFQFYDEDRNPVQMTGSQVLDTAGQLGYRYDGQAAAGRSSMSALGRRKPALLPASRHASRVVGATPQSKPVTLTRGTVNVAIPMSKAGNSIGGAGKAAKPRATLTLKHVAGTGVHGVLFNLSVRGGSKQVNLGAMSLFGSQPDDHHGHGSGDMSFDISNVVAAAGNKNVTVTFEPVDVSDSGLPGGALATIDRLVITVEGAAKPKQAKKTKQQRKKARLAKKARRQKQKRKQQRPSGTTRKRTANPKQKPRQSSVSQQPVTRVAEGNQAATVPGNKNSVFTLPGTEIEDDAVADTAYAHH